MLLEKDTFRIPQAEKVYFSNLNFVPFIGRQELMLNRKIYSPLDYNLSMVITVFSFPFEDYHLHLIYMLIFNATFFNILFHIQIQNFR